ncbi:MAG TPA: GAF domain-containing protein [Chitinophagaceae bacterium]|nr:GAF domain-containing protein [Chitinophagaceae bacterium]
MKRNVIILFMLGVWSHLMAQTNHVFYNLNTSNGLSYIGISDICVDLKGNLWIGTGNGLNKFNGRTTEKYYASEYPQLESSNILAVTCDRNDRIWMITAVGNVSMLDEKRKMHRVSLRRNGERLRAFSFLQTPDGKFYIYVPDGVFQFISQQDVNKLDSIDISRFNFLPLRNYEPYRSMGANYAFAFDENYYLLVFKEGILKVNNKTNTVETRLDIPHAHALQTWAKNELLYYDVGESQLKTVNLLTMQITYPLRGLRDQFGKEITAVINEARPIGDHQYLLTTQNEGIYVWDTGSKKIFNYRHSVADPTSICNNSQSYIAIGQEGWIFMICNPNGIGYFKLNEVVNNQYLFTSSDGKGYDGYIAGVATKDNNSYYIGTSNGMLEWQRSTNTTTFIDLNDPDGKSVFKDFEVTSVVLDDNGNIWATVKDGLIAVDKSKKLIKRFRKADGNLKQRALSRITLGPDGYIWACGPTGICRINTKTFEVDNLENTPLKLFDSAYVLLPLFVDKDNLWLFINVSGIYHYNLSTKKLDELEGFKKYKKTESAFDFGVDKSGNVYLGNTHGLKIFFKDGREKIITHKDGLLIDRVEGLLFDKRNRLWIGNDIGLACYNPADSSLKTFDERYGLSIYGFRVGSYFQMPNGEFVFGTPRGLQYLHPDSLYDKKISLNVLISKIETKRIGSSVTSNAEFNLGARDNQVTFHFSSVEFNPHVRTYYEYKLVDLDKDWIKITDQNSVRYNFLPPGKYVFKVRVSNDNKNWQDADNEVTIVIAAPFYQSWWFKVIGIFVGVFLIWYVLKYYQKKQLKKREELETELVINYFASQINKHQRTEDILWDVAKNCISKLNFEDCVIYLVDDKRNMLIQKAAWGPKMAKDFTIYQPIEIPIGKGIVGSVAESGKPELITNTEFDKRYIADDARRFSELAVPIIINNRVIGIIDSEHSRRNFFTKRHLTILSTVAVLCGTQIERAKAEQDEHETQLIINYFASQIHGRYNADELLQDVAENLFGKLEFEDCMIYVWNEDRTILIQKAGYGLKGSMQEILDKTAYHVPRGKGIVGAAVESKQILLVNDTSKDNRYFTADGKIMLSELCVPLIHDNEVFGAINTEHRQKNFYTPRHVEILSTIAGLCASQLKRIRAEEEKQQARIEALENKQKATETRLQSLRLQMNPHFLFNALNSIQQMILANEELVATRYLSRFSKLLRAILVHSDKEMVTLKEEIDILKLYVELESIRFKESFNYEIIYDDVEIEEVKVPTLLIQPFVENAIWHGLMHKEGIRNLKVEFTENQEFIRCIIEDNGIGRNNAQEFKIKSGQDKRHTSKGIQVSEERLRSMQQHNGVPGSIKIHDLIDVFGKPSGTRVEINFPIKNS